MEFVWREKLAVGVKEIDIQHRVLFSKINDLRKGYGLRTIARSILNEFFDFLEEYAALISLWSKRPWGFIDIRTRRPIIEQHKIFNKHRR